MVYDVLRNLGILSMKPQGNYLIMGSDVAINPRGSMGMLYYFKQKDDAKDFITAFYKNALYQTHIFKGE